MPVVSAGVHRVLDAYQSSHLANFHRRFYATPRRPARSVRGARGIAAVAVASRLRRRPAARAERSAAAAGGDSARHARAHGGRDGAARDRGHRPVALCGRLQLGRSMVLHSMRGRGQSSTCASLPACWSRASIAGLDFNCRSAQEKDICPGTPCRCDLRTNRQRLLWTLVP